MSNNYYSFFLLFMLLMREQIITHIYILFQCRVIDGADSTLDAMEKIPIDEKNRPLQEIKIRSITIHANPIADKS